MSIPTHIAIDRKNMANFLIYHLTQVVRHLETCTYHQPLHTWSRNLPSGQSDRGGNGLTLAGDDVSGREANLHTYWDELAGPRGLRGAALARRAEALSRLCGKPKKMQGPTIWLQESRNLAITVAYGDLPPWPPVSLSPTYAARAQQVGDQQLCKAGKRLGALLQQQLTGDGFPH
ncbi:hypothetical protein J8L76_04865 [Azospira inquinata]|uniref:Uncharacterized protein n=2 Tax=Azospira inquinata TaxID=2785627 RepID=A0A975XVY2_9RHOO|nr:hypothetical protein J8L76_04865 [Azospira inquinata]QWT50326.1 hypothetical protein Azoinq_07005 [Azospira inquinata]